MGSGRDKRKKLKPHAPGTGQAKTERKTAAAEAKRTRRADRATADEDDVDALLARIRLEDAAATEVSVEEDCQPPCGRANASLATVPAPSTGPVRPGEVLLFGGECVDSGGKTRVYGDLYRFEAGKRRWARVKSPGQPPPRSAHQAAVHRNFMYVFGGEFTSPNQERFHHYKDLWRLDITTWQWEQLQLRGAPSARSGHRMVCHKNSLLVFGGFYDTGKTVTYYNDLWQLDLENLKWTCLGAGAPGGLAAWPSPRSGCGLFIHDGGSAAGSSLVLHGGYFREPGEATDDGVEKGVPLHDTWQFQLDEPSTSGGGSSGSAAPRHTWVRLKRQGMGPSPRSGFAAVTLASRRRGFLFGGVSDTEAKGGEVLISEFHSESFILGLDTQRWFPLALRGGAAGANAAGGGPERDASGEKRPAAAGAPAAAPPPPPRPTLTAAEQALHRAATRIQANWRGFAVRKVLHVYRIGGAVSEMTYAPALGFPPPSVATPFGRIGASLCYDPRNDVVWLFGGLVELGDEAEVSFDDLWALRLSRGGTAGGTWDCVRPSTVGKEQLRRMAEEQGRLESLEGSEEGSSDEEDSS